MTSAGLYIHVPFCVRRCLYCDFNTYAIAHPPLDDFIDCVEVEIGARAAELHGVAPATIFFGGGTPSLLGAERVSRLLRAIRDRLGAAAGESEVSLECNPGTVSSEELRRTAGAGVTRLSVGVQSLDDGQLRALGRIHTAAAAREAVRAALEAGFASVGADLLFALPGQDEAGARSEMREAASLGVHHVSAYCLTVEEGTPLGRLVASGAVTLPDDDEQAGIMQACSDELVSHGFERYEISNFARPGHECRHNLTYWTGRPYLGIGPGAHSLEVAGPERTRRANVRDWREWARRVRADGTALESVERLGGEEWLRDLVLTGVRLASGLDLTELREQTGLDPLSCFGVALDRLAASGLVEMRGSRLRLTAAGIPLGDFVLKKLLAGSGRA